MDINSMYSTAKTMIDRVKAARPDAISDDAALCLIFTENMEIFTGISSIRVTENDVLTVSAENNAIMSMISAQTLEASYMITVSFSDYSICIPDEDSLELLFRASDTNYNCNIVVSGTRMVEAQDMENFDAEETQPAAAENAPSPFADNFDSSDFNSGFDFDSVTPDQPVQTLGSPAEFVSNITQDTNNPFYEAPSDAPTADQPVSLNEMPQYNSEKPQSGYMYGQGSVQIGGNSQYQNTNPYQQPMQQGYPQQGMQQPMNNQYGQQPVNPYGQPVNPYGQPQSMNMQQGGYMNGYYQQPMQQGYPQQPVNGGYYNGIVSGQYPQNNNPYQQSTQYQRNSVMVSSMSAGGGKSSAFRKRLNNYMGDSFNTDGESTSVQLSSANSSTLNQVQASANKVAQNMQEGKAPSIDEMMKDAKKQKKVAKVNADFKKKMKDMGL